MADNFNIYEWKYNNLLNEGFDEEAHDLVLNTTAQIKKEFNSLSDEAQQYYIETLMDNLKISFGHLLESKKKVEESLDPEDEVIEISDAEFTDILDRVESEVPFDETEYAYYDEDGIVFGQIADYAMNEVPENKVFYMSLQDVIDGFEDRFDKRLIITGESPEDLQTKHEFAGDFGYTLDKLDEADIEEGRVKKAKSNRKRKKKDRCHRKADQVYGKETSAYKSGAIVKCRQGKQWKKK